MSLIESQSFIPHKIHNEAAVPLFYRMCRLVTKYCFVFQPAVVHLQGQETTIQVREGQSSGRSKHYNTTTAIPILFYTRI